MEEVTSRVASLTQNWAEKKLALKGGAEVADAYIASTTVWLSSLVPIFGSPEVLEGAQTPLPVGQCDRWKFYSSVLYIEG